MTSSSAISNPRLMHKLPATVTKHLPFPSLDMQQEKCAKTTYKTRQPDRQIAPVARITQAKTDNQSMPPRASRWGNGMNYYKALMKIRN